MSLEDDAAALGIDAEKLNQARQYGYKDEDIAQYLIKRKSNLQQPTNQLNPNPTAASIPNPYVAKGQRTGFIEPGGRMVPPAAIDTETGAPFGERFAASFKSSPQERLNYYKEKRGAENVTLSPGGEILFKQGGKWVNVEDAGLSVKDLADLAGDAPEMIGMMLGGWRKKALETAYGAMAGNVVKQGIGASLPGESPRGVLDRAGEVGKAGLGAAVVSAHPVTALATGRVRPSQIARDYLEGRLERMGTTDLAKEGAALNMDVDVKNLTPQAIQQQLRAGKVLPLNVAEETADPWAKMILGFAYRNAYGQELAALDRMAKDKASLAMLKRLSGQLGQEGGFSGPFAESAVSAGRASVKDIEDALAQTKARDFGFLKTNLGERRSIDPTRFNSVLSDTANYYEGMGTKEGLEMGAKLRSMMSLDEAGMPLQLNPRGIQDMMERLHSRGPGLESDKFYRNLRTSSKRELPTELLNALKGDLEAAGKQAGTAGEGARALTGARAKSDELLALRDRLGEIPLLKFMESKGMLNKALTDKGIVGSEQIGQFLREGMMTGKISPTEISNMMKLVQATNPKFAHDFTRYIVDEAVRAGKRAGQEGISPSKFSYQAAGESLPKPEYLQAIYQDIWDPTTKSTGMRITGDLSRLMRAIQRAETVGQGIPHSPGQTAVGIIGHLMNANVGAASKQVLSQIAFPKLVANMALNPNARREALAELAKMKAAEGEKGFLREYYERGLPPLLYELGSSVQRQNRAETGE